MNSSWSKSSAVLVFHWRSLVCTSLRSRVRVFWVLRLRGSNSFFASFSELKTLSSMSEYSTSRREAVCQDGETRRRRTAAGVGSRFGFLPGRSHHQVCKCAVEDAPSALRGVLASKAYARVDVGGYPADTMATGAECLLSATSQVCGVSAERRSTHGTMGARQQCALAPTARAGNPLSFDLARWVRIIGISSGSRQGGVNHTRQTGMLFQEFE
jgi:hypothetical protein